VREAGRALAVAVQALVRPGAPGPFEELVRELVLRRAPARERYRRVAAR